MRSPSLVGTVGMLDPSRLARVDLLILDGGLALMTKRRDLLEITEDRQGRGSTIVTSQLPVEHWHDIIGEPTIADAISIESCTTPRTSRSQRREPAKGAPSVTSLKRRARQLS